MRAEFFRPDAPDRVVGTARWDGRRVEIETGDEAVRAVLERVFKPSFVPVDDSAMRARGTSGPILLEPGHQEWFRTAARVRGEVEGLSVRLVIDRQGGWDPALDPRTYGWAGPKTPSLQP
jgi:hypothetical protein